VREAVELAGVSRAKRALEQADLVLLVLDGSREPDELERETLTRVETEAGRWVAVVNKSDLPQRTRLDGTIAVSAKSGEGVPVLRAALREKVIGGGPPEHPTVTNGRHAAALERAAASLVKAGKALERGLTEEWVLEDLKQARRELATVTGEFGVDDLYDRIFSTFCIGK
jgi:tRNA modification GTPase